MTKIADPRGALLAELKRYCNSRDKAAKLIEGLTVRIFLASYAYCEASIAFGDAAHVSDAIQKLSNSLRRARMNVQMWVYTGKWMRDQGLDGKNMMSTAITRAYHAWGALREVERAKIRTVLRNDGSCKSVMQVLRLSSNYRVREEMKRVQRMEQDGRFNKTTMKMEMLAWKTFAESFFGSDCVIEIKDSSGKVLMKVNGE